MKSDTGSVHAFHRLPLLLTIGTVVPLDFLFVCTVTNNELINRKTNFPTYKEHSSSSNYVRDVVNICICPEDYCGVKFGIVHFRSHLNGVYFIRLNNPENLKMGRSLHRMRGTCVTTMRVRNLSLQQIFIVTPCINDIKPFLVQLMHL